MLFCLKRIGGRMKTKIAVIVILVLVSTLARAETLKTLSLDDSASISPKIETDTGIKVEGTGSIRIMTKWPTTVCLGEVTGLDVENAKLVYSARVKTELEDAGTAYLEMWAHLDGGQYFSRGMNDVVSGKSDWKRIKTPFMFQKDQKPDKVTLNILINGKGTVWIDELVLSREPLR